MKLELCTDSVQGALAAKKYQLDRIELCSALTVGGLTPSAGLIAQCVAVKGASVQVMIRHKEGDFRCSEEDIQIMKSDINLTAELKASGVVFGILDEENGLSQYNKQLLDLAKSLNLEVTFHRVFDLCKDPFESIEKLIDWGFDRLLTSGQKPKAQDGIDLIKELQLRYGSQIQIMAGSGVNRINALKFKEIGIENLHFTAHQKHSSISLGMGAKRTIDETKIKTISNLFTS